MTKCVILFKAGTKIRGTAMDFFYIEVIARDIESHEAAEACTNLFEVAYPGYVYTAYFDEKRIAKIKADKSCFSTLTVKPIKDEEE